MKTKPAKKTKFFHYSQNNSGGSFAFDLKAGITHHVIIEARDAEHANERAEAIGLYWDGCADNRDCSCCGDRWSRLYGSCEKGDREPMVYGIKVVEGFAKEEISLWMKPGLECAVHPLTGKIKWFGGPKAKATK